MASPSVQRPPQRTAETYGDYIPDDFSDFGGLISDDEQSGKAAGTQQTKSNGTAGLGIDEEVSVKKRAREPRVKLDESRLLSSKGIPALRKQARVLKLKGKGHEFSNASRLLSMYQLWLDDLFPKARFADALAMVEKEGHKASMGKMRMEWINESKPKDAQDELDGEPVLPSTELDEGADHQHHPQQQPQARPTNAEMEGSDAVPYDLLDEDPYDSLQPARQIQSAGDGGRGQIPDESELDALMADAMEIHGPQEYLPPRIPVPEDDIYDLDALIAEAEAAS
ncbi:replication fork protection complex subunit Csm3/Swi3 [Sporothrix schenckii 1099-18]|uniref:Chromosome segregation in meiosis protein n=1 Tax=Sporothrix schenckii 1099-18 TaxID=1397361 RepID=A0A0F2M3G7_SPOSC|nr:replication fork protection complex subunit Csm3/Swi3 [Sporothrix schenckii 1099-18]KJR83310.1 replication fork protection complex subunit Csm3/Swi3 [Sporothrix schenckii 1099-18]